MQSFDANAPGNHKVHFDALADLGNKIMCVWASTKHFADADKFYGKK